MQKQLSSINIQYYNIDTAQDTLYLRPTPVISETATS